mmetsp:Transcript_29537/g.45087  ORF Transcript_29537/g.45087 Transcript_29537/m.45087 type:complete len:221 (+) Transcript_29537:75-737(+)
MAALLCQSISSLFSSACTGCGKICKLPFTMCSGACSSVCGGVKQLCTSHFCIYGTLALGLNIPPMIFGLSAIPYVDCKGTQWMLMNTLFCLCHILAAMYIANQQNSWSDIMHTLCYDPWMAAYIVVSIASFIWTSNGLSLAISGAMANGNNCPDNIASLTYNSIYFGFSFFFFGASALAISLLVSACMGSRDSGKETYHMNTNNGDTSSKASYMPFASKV